MKDGIVVFSIVYGERYGLPYLNVCTVFSFRCLLTFFRSLFVIVIDPLVN